MIEFLFAMFGPELVGACVGVAAGSTLSYLIFIR